MARRRPNPSAEPHASPPGPDPHAPLSKERGWNDVPEYGAREEDFEEWPAGKGSRSGGWRDDTLLRGSHGRSQDLPEGDRPVEEHEPDPPRKTPEDP